MIYFCSQKNRRALVLQHANLNGIDYLEVARQGSDCGKQLLITLLKDACHLTLAPSQVQITGGASAKAQVTVLSVSPGTDAAPKVVTVELNQSGDFSTYTLSLVADPTTTDPPPGFDPQLSTVSFSFKAGCPTVADCLPNNCCPPDMTPEPDINYLAKDFGGFRQVMLDRMAVLAPAWAETHESDMGIALVEVLAYVADHLSYQQDAVGTEAYLGTARSRISLRRHAKLVDYKINEGSNARVWVYINVTDDGVFIPSGTLIFPRVSGYATTIPLQSTQATALLNGGLGFATMQDSVLYQEQNQIDFYTWGDSDCCLAPGATTATLVGTLTSLQPGSILVFEEIVGPNTGDTQDANPNNRWAVRLTAVQTTDHLGNTLVDPLFDSPSTPAPITQISWAAEDALPFPLCLSSTTDEDHGSLPQPYVSVACGNIIPADYGIWQNQPLFGTVALTNSSATVTGSGTIFLSVAEVDQWLVFASDPTQTPYQISAIANDTSLTLATPYTGASTPPLAPTTAAVIQDLGVVPSAPAGPVVGTSCTCNSQTTVPAPRPRYYPQLANSPVTFAYPANVLVLGTVSLTQGSDLVTGSNTSFTSTLTVGQSLVFASDPTLTPYTIVAIASNTSLTLGSNYAGATATTTANVGGVTPASQFLAPASSGTSRAQPVIKVQDDQGQVWQVLDDLLSSTGLQTVCVLEVESNGAAFLRFGDDQYGLAPETGTDFQVQYRVGNGTIGNIGRDSLAHIITTPLTTKASAISVIRNPLAAAGGMDPETMEQIRQEAPFAFLTQLRCVTEDDYGVMAQQAPAIREARGTLRWTGSWYTAFVSEDTYAEGGPDAALLASTKARLNLLRMMGVDLEVEGAVIVGLDVEMTICVDPDYFQADVETALMQLFTTGNQCTGQPGLLNPDNFTFGETIYTSPFIAAAQGVQGVTSAVMSTFLRMDDPSIDGATQGYLTMGRLEIARCDNDPNRLDHGVFALHMDGGK
jgi:predicted phage baseplate assembly protein